MYFFKDGDALGDPAWYVDYFEGKSSRITFGKWGDAARIAEITDITLRPAPTMTYLNPRPAPTSIPYPWSFDAAPNNVIKLPVSLTFEELAQGAQIVVSGVTDAMDVIQGSLVSNVVIEFRAGGLLIGVIGSYSGKKDLVQFNIDEGFTGEIHAVNFVKAFKNLPAADSVRADEEEIVSYLDGLNPIAKCVLNGVAIFENIPFLPSNGLLGNIVFQSQYIANYGNVIESYYWTNGRYLYIIRLNESYSMQAINLDSTVSPLNFPII